MWCQTIGLKILTKLFSKSFKIQLEPIFESSFLKFIQFHGYLALMCKKLTVFGVSIFPISNMIGIFSVLYPRFVRLNLTHTVKSFKRLGVYWRSFLKWRPIMVSYRLIPFEQKPPSPFSPLLWYTLSLPFLPSRNRWKILTKIVS